MALWKVDIEKLYNTEYWTNRYFVEADGLDAADAVALDIVAAERAILYNTALMTKYRVSDLVPGTDNFRTTVLGQFGLVAPQSAFLPFFNVVRVDFSTGSGRPSRKFLRGCLTLGDVDGFNLTAARYNAIVTNYADPMSVIAAHVDVDGQAFTSLSVYQPISMRQLRRGSKRATQPVIP